MAVSVTVTSTAITVTSTGGVLVTMSDVVTAVGDTSVMEEVGTTITIKRAAGQIYRSFNINSGCMVEIEEDYTINMQGITNTSSYTQWILGTGAYLKINPGVTIDFNSDNQTYARSYCYWYGELDSVGTLAKYISFKKYRIFYANARMDQTWNYCKFLDNVYVSGYYIAIGDASYTDAFPTVEFKHCIVQDTTGNKWGTGIYGTGFAMPYSNYTFEDIRFEDLYYGLSLKGACIKLKDCYFTGNTNYSALSGCGNAGGCPISSSTIAPYTTQNILQPSVYFDNCTFDNEDLGVYGTYQYYGTHSVYKNCTFKNQSSALYITYQALVSVVGTITFDTITTEYYRLYGGANLMSNEIGITVQDSDGNPIECAAVSIRENNGYERWSGFTDSNGELLTTYGDKPILVQTAYSSDVDYEDWSAHTVTVAKAGYNKSVVALDVDSDKDIIITLTTENTQGTVINNSTIYGSVIY